MIINIRDTYQSHVLFCKSVCVCVSIVIPWWFSMCKYVCVECNVQVAFHVSRVCANMFFFSTSLHHEINMFKTIEPCKIILKYDKINSHFLELT